MRRWAAACPGLLVVVMVVMAQEDHYEDRVHPYNIRKSTNDLLPSVLGDLNHMHQGFIDLKNIGMNLLTLTNKISNEIFESSPGSGSFSTLPNTFPPAKLLRMFEAVCDHLENMEQRAQNVKRTLKHLDTEGKMVPWKTAADAMTKYSAYIDFLYNKSRVYQGMATEMERVTLIKFAKRVVSAEPPSIQAAMARLHSLTTREALRQATAYVEKDKNVISVLVDDKFFRHEDERVNKVMKSLTALLVEPLVTDMTQQMFAMRYSLFDTLKEALKDSDPCHLYQSQQQLVMGLHLLLVLTQSKGFLLLDFSWTVLRLFNGDKFTVQQEMTRLLYRHYVNDLYQEAATAAAGMARDLYRCDPSIHHEGHTFEQLTELLQGFIVNEADLNSDSSCKQDCHYYQHAYVQDCVQKWDSTFCDRQRPCEGEVRHCHFFGTHSSVCLSKKPFRRYDFIRYRDVRLGSETTCEGEELRVNSWWNFMSRCTYCVCVCDDPASLTSDRYVSLTPALTNVQENMVVTGMKFVKEKHVIHIQIQQGRTLPQGQVDRNSIQWLHNKLIQVEKDELQEGKAYKKLNYNERSVDLDRLEAPHGYVVTGVGFRMLGQHLNLRVRITPIDYWSGKLHDAHTMWLSSDSTPSDGRKEHLLQDPGDPTTLNIPSEIDSVANTFIQFTNTDMKKDVAQLTVPFFDSQKVSPVHASWLAGLEIFHKGSKGSGGFLGLRVITYDVSSYMNITFTL